MSKLLIKYIIIKESIKSSWEYIRYNSKWFLLLLWPTGILYILFTTKKYRQRYASILFDDADENELPIILDIYWQLSMRYIVSISEYDTKGIGLYINVWMFLRLNGDKIVIESRDEIEEVSLSNPNYISEIIKTIDSATTEKF